MAINIPGLVGIVIFYLVILIVGIWAGRKSKNRSDGGGKTEEIMLAGRKIGVVVGIFTMTATWVEGGYINGTAEGIFTQGLAWCQAPFAYSFSLIIAAMFFASKMRKAEYVTMIDSFEEQFGRYVSALLTIPAMIGEILVTAATLAALGATVSVIVGLDRRISVIVSCFIAVLYTFFGGLYSVVYTDVIQLLCMVIGMWLCIPFALHNEAVGSLSTDNIDWVGSVEKKHIALFVDTYIGLTLGGIPWQTYFQRVLSTKTAFRAQALSYAAGVGCFIMAIPPIILGIVGKATAWNETAYTGPYPMDEEHSSQILPLVLQYLTPAWVSFIGLGAVSAAVMSSCDSCILSCSSMFARNIYKAIIRKQASEKEVILVMRGTVLIVASLATYLALQLTSIYALWFLCSDLIYIVLFPQLVAVLHFKKYSNAYGSIASLIVAVLLRVLAGEPLIGLTTVLRFPYYDEEKGEQLFPFKTFVMLVSFITLLVVSCLTNCLFGRSNTSSHYVVNFSRGLSPSKKEKDVSSEGSNDLAMGVKPKNTVKT